MTEKPRKSLSKSDILSADDLKREWVDVPEWGGGVYVTSFSADTKDALEVKLMAAAGKTGGIGFRAAYCALAMVDDMGRRLFTDEEAAMLGTKFAGALDRIFEVVSRINRISEKDIEDLEKNSAAAPGAASPSDSV